MISKENSQKQKRPKKKWLDFDWGGTIKIFICYENCRFLKVLPVAALVFSVIQVSILF
jgi:hypothetical protein